MKKSNNTILTGLGIIAGVVILSKILKSKIPAPVESLEPVIQGQDRIRVTKDKFIWLLVNDKAKEIYNIRLFDLYELFNDDSESFIDTYNDLQRAIRSGNDIAIEVGYYKRK